MSTRPDQVRDKDSIQRDTIRAKIVGPVDAPIFRDDQEGIWTLFLIEPKQGGDIARVAKFSFEFKHLKQIEDVVKALQLEIKAWRERGYKD